MSLSRPYIIILTSLLLGFYSIGLKGQDITLDQYQSDVKEGSLLFRGEVARKYVYRYQGTYFAYNDQYFEGEVFYNGRYYRKILINLNAHTDEVSARMSDRQLPVVLDKRYVDWFTIAGKRFVHYRKGDVPGLDAGYYEILYDRDGKILVKKTVKKYKENLERDVVMVEFVPKIDYYVIVNGTCRGVNGKGGFMKVFPGSKKAIRKAYRDVPSVVRENKDRLFIKYMEVSR